MVAERIVLFLIAIGLVALFSFCLGVSFQYDRPSSATAINSPYGCYLEWQGKQYKFDCEDGK